MHKLPGELYKELLDALLSAFPTYSKLEQMVFFQLNERLNLLVGGDTLTDTVFYLIGWAEETGKLELLITGARKSNSGNLALKEFEEKFRNFLASGELISHESIPARNLKDILSKDNIYSVSLILDDSTSFVGTECIIGGRRIYLDSRLEDVDEEIGEKNFGHLNIYFPIQEFNVTENMSIEDEVFVSGLVGYIANHSRILKFSVEKFGVIPAVFKNFQYLEELRILECKNIKSVPWDMEYLIKLETLTIQDTGIDTFPNPVFKLLNLTHLDLSGNQLRSIPSEISHFSKLIKLSLLNNPLESLPPELNQLRNLQSLLAEERLIKTFGIVVGRVVGNSSSVMKEGTKSSKESLLNRIINLIFLSFPKTIGRLFFDLFGQHEPAKDSTLIIGYILIAMFLCILGLAFTAFILVLFGVTDSSTLWDLLLIIWQFISNGKQ